MKFSPFFLALLLTFGAGAASADDWHDGGWHDGGWHDGGWRGGGWGEHEWHDWHEHWDGPGYGYRYGAPPPVVYVPPPVYAPPPPVAYPPPMYYPPRFGDDD